ncbi:Hsp70 nucleotide exchange factor fes1 [Lophiotrema nucula]|uniref:Hsp70 nucleotide exchange factor fes1 n=1 Tax=Lophiotrema nucula TaxID=690887 RepID=A0A6A5ZNI8_9PLEO|nr:Hsp70 nucleotide exchange factor fes1 [Lophiotrema nucula]
MNDPNLNTLLKWSVENSEASKGPDASRTPLNPEAIAALFGQQKSDAQRMEEELAVIDNQDGTRRLEDRLTAFDNYEMLVENLDNANNMESLGHWTRLVKHLEDAESEIRMYAAWCCATAVQNNLRSQERLLVLDAVPTLAKLATQDTDKAVRKKAILALSSAIRNFQPSLDAAIPNIPEDIRPKGGLDATDMDSIDNLVSDLRGKYA